MTTPTTPAIDWSAGLRDYQISAVTEAITRLPTEHRGTIVMACGSGKTRVAIAAAEVLAARPGTTTLVLAPSLALLDQLFRSWRTHSQTAHFVPLIVCSDDDLGAPTSPDTYTPQFEVTTDPQAVAQFLTGPATTPKIVFATYHSTPVIAAATMSAEHQWTLAICDEAHRTAGKAGAVFTTILSNTKIPCDMRLFLTASPRVHAVATANDTHERASMDNTALYGERLFTYTFGQGITEGVLSDYRVLVMVVDSVEVHRSIERNIGLHIAGRPINAARAASVMGYLRAADEHDLSRAIVFHNTISASRNFADDLTYLANNASYSDRPVDSFHLDGLASSHTRKIALNTLAKPAPGSRVVVNNVRVLTEGVDIPALDAVMFAEPKSSQVDVIQAVGRAIRPNPDRGAPSVVIVPVCLAAGENPAAVLAGSTFKHVWQVLNALRDHDTALDTELAAIRRNSHDPDAPTYEPGVLPEKVIISGFSPAAEAFTQSITTMLLDHTTTTWAYGLDRFRDYTSEHESAQVPSRHIDPATRFPLGQWVQSQRQAYRWGRLTPDQIGELETAGFEYGQRSAQWRKNVALIQTLTTGTGSTNMTNTDLCVLAPSLAPWFRSLIERNSNNKLTQSEKRELSDLCAWVRDPIGGVFRRPADVDTLCRMAKKRPGKLLKNISITIDGRRTDTSDVHGAVIKAARFGLLTDPQRHALAGTVGADLPEVAADIDVTVTEWEPDSLRRIARYTTEMTPGSEPQKLPATTTQGAQLNDLITGPHGYWKTIVMANHPQRVHGVDNAMAALSELVEDAQWRAGCTDDFVVLANNTVIRRPQGDQDWIPSGRLRDHVDMIVAVQTNTPDPGAPTVVVEDSVTIPTTTDDNLPLALSDAVGEAITRAFQFDSRAFATQLLKSYGVKRVHLVGSIEERDEFLARAHRRRQRPALITERMRDDLNETIVGVRTKILREAASLTFPKVAEAYREGRLRGWPQEDC